MGVSGALRRMAFTTPTAFPVLGWGGDRVWRRYLDEGRATPIGAPHDADVLALAGEIPAPWTEALRALFETLARPRCAVWLPPPWACEAPVGLPLAGSAHEPQPDLLDPDAGNNQPILEDKPPSPWRDEGDHGQGGKGMMGGKPYGRAMAMTGPDPDGLMLGQVTTSLGPFFSGLPSGLHLELAMQGDRIGSVNAIENWFPDRTIGGPGGAPGVPDQLGPALRAAQGDEVRIADLERARIESHLVWSSTFLHLAGLPALGERFSHHAEITAPDQLTDLFAAAERRGLKRVCTGLGRIVPEQVTDLGLMGPVARASGHMADGRSADANYAALSFRPCTSDAGDVWARWRVRRDECLQSARLIQEAEARRTTAAEAPRGQVLLAERDIRTPSRANLAVIEHVLPGLLWSEAVLVLASLDLDMAEAALR